jgi:alpha-1,6-mannosyltransferase
MRPGRAVALVALPVCVAATALEMLDGRPSLAGTRLAMMIVAMVGFGALLVAESQVRTLTKPVVFAATGVALAVAVAVPPQGSGDLWSYAAYGRTLAHYHASPYRLAPDAFPSDPIFSRVAPAWRATKSVYGPVFVATAAGGSALAGSSPLANRLFFQGLAALAVLASMLLLARQGAEAGALASLGLNPVVATAVVNGGHNDAMVGLAVLAGIVLAIRGRPVAAGAVVGVAALVKIVAVLPLAAVAAWAWRAKDRKVAVRVAAAGVGAVLAGYAVAGGLAAVSPVLADTGYHSRASVWTAVRGFAPAFRSPFTAVLVLAALVLAVLTGRARRPLPVAAGSAVAAYLLGAPYVLPWYVAWALPVLALVWRSPVSALVLAYAGALAVAYLNGPLLDPDDVRRALVVFTKVAIPVLAAAGLVYLVAVSWRGRVAPAADRAG